MNPRFAEKARQIAIETRMDKGWSYRKIARDVLGGAVRAAQVYAWCKAFEEEQRGTIGASGIEALPNSTIMALFGGKGSGKSLTGSAKALDYYCEGVPVFYNPRGLLKFPPIEGGVCEFASLHDIILRADKLRNCLVVLDELQVNLSKFRTSTRASILIRGVIQQCRKLGMDIIITSNSPRQIDPGFAEQLDFHTNCRAHLPPRDLADYIDLHWVDTQGYYGKGPSRMFGGRQADTRLRAGETLWPASLYFKYYDHSVQVDPMEVMGLTADMVQLAKEESDIGLSIVEMKHWVINTLVPALVTGDDPADRIVPSIAVDFIARTFPKAYDHLNCCRSISTQHESDNGCTDGAFVPFLISPILLGKALTEAGLQKRSGAYILPDPDNLPKFQAGLWAPKKGD